MQATAAQFADAWERGATQKMWEQGAVPPGAYEPGAPPKLTATRACASARRQAVARRAHPAPSQFSPVPLADSPCLRAVSWSSKEEMDT